MKDAVNTFTVNIVHGILCTSDEVNFTNKDGEKVFKIDYLQKYQKRMAENEQDFELIYQREWTQSGITDDGFFKNFLLEIVSGKEEEYKASLTNKEKEEDAKTFELFYNFKNWIKKRETNSNWNTQGNHYNAQASKEELDRYIIFVEKIVELLIPNSTPTDTIYIEKNIEQGLNFYKELLALRQNIWLHWENIVMSELSQRIKEAFFFRFSKSFMFNYDKYQNCYNKVILEEAEHRKMLYNSTELKHLIYGLRHVLENDLNEYKRFAHLYHLQNLNLEEKKIPTRSKLNFGYRKTNPEILVQIYNGLTEQLDGFISEEENTLIKVFTAEDLSELPDTITLQCDNPQFHFIISNMQYLFKEKILSIIGKSGKFFSKRRTVLTANSLSKAGSNQPIPKGKEKIERIFRQIKQ